MTSGLAQLIREAFNDAATDVFIVAGEAPRIRHEGEVIIRHPDLISQAAMEQFWCACGVDPATHPEADVSWQLPQGGRLQVNLYHTLGRLAAVLRPIRDQIPALAELGLPAALLESWMQRRYGLILVTGPTGSGKSTTVAACLDWINRHHARHIVTLEDPIEFIFQHSSCLIKQREIGGDSRSFPRALRQALRQDPDVIVVSEMRDLDTIRIALTAAETGHLVLATLHTADAPQTIDRLVDVFPADQQPQIVAQLSSALEGIICQRLIPRADGHGRVLASEVLVPGYGIRNCIRDRKLEQIVGLMEIGHRDGNRTIDQSIASLLDSGLITREEAIFHSRERKTFEAPPPVPRKPKSIWT